MRPYPLMMNLEDRLVVVVGGGRVAVRKVETLLESGANVVVISPRVIPEMAHIVQTGAIQLVAEEFREDHLNRYSDAVLVFGTTDLREVNVRIHAAAQSRGIPCNIADVPDLCTFIVPAVVTRGDLTISISTGGASPALARRIREDLENRFGAGYARMTKIMAELRPQVLQLGKSSDENKKLFMQIVDSDLLQVLSTGDRGRAVQTLREMLPDGIDVESAVQSGMSID